MSDLEKLYYNISNLSDDYADSEEVKKARRELEGALGSETYFNCEEQLIELESLNEKQGFICGFQYAVSLLTNGKALQAK